jgi:ATP-binding cassette subfamily F protein uup
MALISLRKVSVQYGGPAVLDQISLSIEPGERACVTGRNGEGKSTLLKLLAGLIVPDTGERIIQPDLRVAYLSQDVPGDLDGTVAEIAGSGVVDNGACHAHHPGAAMYLSQLKLDGAEQFNTLSGGLRRRALLARALAAEPHLLLLDEPTNHLDIETIEWIETFLQRSPCACLFVTHDRAFLKRVATRVLDLDRGRLIGWDCDYDTFLRRKQEQLDDEAVYWSRQTRKLEQEEAWLRRGVKARTTRNEGRVAALLQLRETFRQRRTAPGVSRFQLDLETSSGEQVLKVSDVSFAYPGGAPVVCGFSAKILRGERIGIIGPNGSGKTTLLNLLCGHLTPDSGYVQPGARVEIALFDQLRSALDLDRTVQQNLAEDREEVMVGGVRKHVFGYLSDFLFTPDRARTPVRALSGGERARLMLAKLFLQPGNLLVMDEPTNDLDMETLELLEEQLMNYDGTLLLVSHDRTFLDNVVTGTFVLDGSGKVELYPGGYSDWLRQRPAPSTLPAVEPDEASVALPARTPPSERRRERLTFKQQRDRQMLPQQIESLETEIASLHAVLSDPEHYRREPDATREATGRLAQAEAELEAAFKQWVELETLAERLEK